MPFGQYINSQTESKAAYAQYNYASTWLEVCHMRERNAELVSQAFEHVAKGKLFDRIGTITEREREVGLAFSRYATYGRTDI